MPPRSRRNGRQRRPQPRPETPIVVGVCAMDKKTGSSAMHAILSRLAGFAENEFKIVIFGDDVILNQPIERWPVVECFICFHSDGFPLAKAEAYVARVKPAYVVNDVSMQHLLLDRRTVYNTLMEAGIPVPRHVCVSRDAGGVESLAPAALRDDEFEETEEFLRVGSTKVSKPFVEKPVNADDHNICIYYHHSTGGGMKRLFRKVGNQASAYVEPPAGEPYTRIRRHGSFLYEDFLHTGGTDVKVYTMGPDYAHAEARKSPVVDGRVMRDENGKEVRYPVVLTPEEKEIARRVVLAFGQAVCGFDLLRCKGRSYVCDVNGWSFVKNSEKYYDDAACVLRALILAAVAPTHKSTAPARSAASKATDEATNPRYGRTDSAGRGAARFYGAAMAVKAMAAAKGRSPAAARWRFAVAAITQAKASAKARADATPQPQEGSVSPGERERDRGDGGGEGIGERPHEELRCVLAVVRHGDRTPKQKMKLRVTDPRLLELVAKHNGGRPRKQAKLKRPAQLQELLDVVRAMVGDAARRRQQAGPATPGEDWEEEEDKLRQCVAVLEEGGHFSGINRKAQLKPLAWAPIVPMAAADGGGLAGGGSSGTDLLSSCSSATSLAAASVAEGGTQAAGDGGESVFGGEVEERVTAALLVLKFGGVLTPLGRAQAEALGRNFRNTMYPPYEIDEENEGGMRPGLLRLHSTYRHDLKIYSSDEGRVQMSAAAFAKGLLDLETPRVRDGNAALTPILASLVIKDAKMLDFITDEVSADINSAKSKLYQYMTEGSRVVDSSSGGSEDDGGAAMSRAVRRGVTAPVSVAVRRDSGGEVAATEAEVAAALAARLGGAALDDTSPRALRRVAERAEGPDADDEYEDDWFDPDASPPPLPPFAAGDDATCVDLAANEAAVRSRPLGTCVESAVNARPPGVPAQPLRLLHRMLALIKLLTRQLSGAYRQANARAGGADDWAERLGPLAPHALSPTGGASAVADGGFAMARTPAGSESFLLMHARWKKLERDIYHEKKNRFDISKIPDVYDSAKYDAIHNAHLQLDGLAELLPLSKLLADGCVPNEYGTHPHSKLRIGATIAAEVVKKLLIDLSNTRDETFLASRRGEEGDEEEVGGSGSGGGRFDSEVGISSWQRGVMAERKAREAAEAAASSDAAAAAAYAAADAAAGSGAAAAAAAAADVALEAAAAASEADAEGGDAARDDLEDSEEDEQRTRLHPGADVNSPHRHVRTRVYFTSESHIHSLISVLRHAHLEPPPVAPPPSRPGSSLALVDAEAESLGEIYAGKWWRSGSTGAYAPAASAPATPAGAGAAPLPPPPAPLLSREADATLAATPEFDYLSQIVFRMFERFDFPADHPQRFRLELSFSRGAAVDWARAPQRPASASGSGGSGSGGSAPALPEAAYAGALFTRTPLQCDAGGRGMATATQAGQGAAGPGSAEEGTGFLTLSRAEATLWRFGRQPAARNMSSGLPPLPPSAAPHSSLAPTPVPSTASTGSDDAAPAARPAAAIALIGRLASAER